MKLKKIVCMLLIMVITLTVVTPVMAGEQIAVMLDGEFIDFEVKPQIVNDRTMVPLRPILEALDATVGWEDATKTVTSTKGDVTIELTINDPVIYINGEAKPLDSPACLINNRTLVPARAVSEAFGITVGWDSVSRIVLMSSTSDTIEMHNEYGETVFAEISEVDAYKKDNWFVAKPVKLYSEDGSTKYFEVTDVEDYKKNGWYDGPVATVYGADGSSKKIGANEKNDYLAAGWYDEPMATVGTLDGRNKVIKKSDLEAYKEVGWYHIPPVELQTENIGEATVLNGTNIATVKNYITPSSVQQFKYKNQGIAYAYMNENYLTVVTPSTSFTVKARYPLLGDVIADNEGNIYVVWGRENTTDNQSAKTIFVTKYDGNGTHILTTGFVGEGSSGKTENNTQKPFHGGSCHSVITPDGRLVVNYGRKMYNTHQSNNVIALTIADMKQASTGWKIPYTSHSFNQRVLYSKLAEDLVFADLGDANERGFIITIKSRERNVFNFYLKPDADYNMAIINKTFAQLGGLVETDKGVVLVGASAKSIGPEAEDEVQNLFVQVINPNEKELGAEMFVGGTIRTGKTSPDINDTKEKDIPLKEVTDYGVQWITNSATHNVVAPHSIAVGNKIVILWNNVEKNTKEKEGYYTVLANDGKVIVPPTSLGKDVVFNSAEDPVYNNGRIYWIATKDGKIQKISIKMPE